MASFIGCQLADQFWSVNLVTSAFGVQIPNISNRDITKVDLSGNHPTLESLSPPDIKMTCDAAQRRYKMFFCLPVFPMLRLLSHASSIRVEG